MIRASSEGDEVVKIAESAHDSAAETATESPKMCTISDVRELYKLRKVTPSSCYSHQKADEPSKLNEQELKLFSRIIRSGERIISVQRDADNPTSDDLNNYLKQLYSQKSDQFLHRFGGFLESQDFILFSGNKCSKVKMHLEQLKIKMKECGQKRIKNRRFGKLQDLLKEGEYFSEDEMEKRDPELFYSMVGR